MATSNPPAGAVGSGSISQPPSGAERASHRRFSLLAMACAAGIIVLVLAIVWEIARQAVPAISAHGVAFLWRGVWNASTGEFGILPEIWGTPYSSLPALAIGGFLAGYAYVNRMLAYGIDPFRRGQHAHLRELNNIVLCGTDPDARRRFHRHIEGNHRTGSMIMSFLLVRAGKPPFVVKPENAKGYFDPSTLIRMTRKHTLKALWQLPMMKKTFAEFLKDHVDKRALAKMPAEA